MLLQQFARFPQRGAVKTRLQGELGEGEAYRVHCELLELTARNLLASGLGPVQLWLDRLDSHPLLEHCRSLGLSGPLLQRGRDLGARMHYALQAGLTRHGAVLLVGSDCPGISADYLHAAHRQLLDSDVVLGAAEDGGYVLIGCRRICATVFADVPWGSADVLARTAARVRSLGWRLDLLPALADIDTPADLRRWRAAGG